MNRSYKRIILLIVFLAVIYLQLCQAYPEPVDVKNEEVHQEFGTDAQTLSQIEEENTDQISEGDLKRASRKAPCPFSKLKSGGAAIGSIVSSAVPCGASASLTSETKGNTLVSVERSDGYEVLTNNLIDIGTSLQGALLSIQKLVDYMPIALTNLRTEVETVNASPVLVHEVQETCNNYVKAEKNLNGVISHFTNLFNFPSFKKGQVRYENFEIGGCLDNIKTNMMNFLATIRSWFSCDKLFSSNKGFDKFQSYVNSIPSGAQCNILNTLGKSGHYVGIPQVSAGYYANRAIDTSTQVNTVILENQVEQIKQVLQTLENFPSALNALMQNLKVSFENQLNQITTVTNAQRIQAPQVPTVQIPVNQPVYTSQNIMSIKPLQTVQTYTQQIPVTKTNFYVAPRVSQVSTSVSAPTFCSGQSLIDQISNAITFNPVIKQSGSFVLSSSNGNMNSGKSKLDLLQVRVNLSRDTVRTLLSGQIPQAGDIIVLNLTDDVMIIGSPYDDISPITFNFIYRGISLKSRYNNNVFIWNISNDDFACNQDIFNDVLGHLIYSQ